MNKMLGDEEAVVLLKLRKHFPTAVIAGGAVRDTLLGIPYTNVDICIPKENPISKRYGFGWLVDEFLPEHVFGENDQMYHLQPYAGLGVHNAMPMDYLNKVPYAIIDTVYKNTQYHLIFGPNLKMGTFNFNCDQAAWNGIAFKEAPAFIEFKKDRILRQTANKDHTFVGVIEKLLAKIPDLKLDDKLTLAMKEYWKKKEEQNKERGKKSATVTVKFEAPHLNAAKALQEWINKPVGFDAPLAPPDQWVEIEPAAPQMEDHWLEDAIAAGMWAPKKPVA